MKAMLRTTQPQFEELLEQLVTCDDIGLRDLPAASAAQQLAIFLYICGHDNTYRVIDWLPIVLPMGQRQ